VPAKVKEQSKTGGRFETTEKVKTTCRLIAQSLKSIAEINHNRHRTKKGDNVLKM